MNIPKAIGKLEDLSPSMAIPCHQDYWAAIKLGIEALKRLKKLREDNAPRANFILPSETKD